MTRLPPLAPLIALEDIDGIVAQRRACSDACGYVQWKKPFERDERPALRTEADPT